MRQIIFTFLALFASALAVANPPSILNNSTHEVYQDVANFAALGINCSSSLTCSAASAPSSTVLAINQTGSGVNTNILYPGTLISDALNLSVPEFGVEGTTPLTPVVTYQVAGVSATFSSSLTTLDQQEYATLEGGGLILSYAYCGVPQTGDYPPVASVSVLPNNLGAAPAQGGCGYAQGIEFSIAQTSGKWTPVSPADGSMDVSSPSASQNALQVVLSALKLNNPTWNWFDVVGALRQTASNWATGYVAFNASGPAFGFGNLSYTGANAVGATSNIFLQAPGMTTRVVSGGQVVQVTLYPFRQSRRTVEVIYSEPAGYAWPVKNEYTTADLSAAGGTLLYTSNGTDVTPVFNYAPAVSGTVTLVAFTTDGAGNYSRVESYGAQSVSLNVGVCSP